jgi:hypothetical protein
MRTAAAKEKVVGWYHSGPKLRASDLAINERVRRYAPSSVLVIVDVKPADVGLPTTAYYAVEEIKDVRGTHIERRRRPPHHSPARCGGPWCWTVQDGTQTTKTFAHVPTEIRAAEAEEIGVEHLLRDVKDNGARARLWSCCKRLWAWGGWGAGARGAQLTRRGERGSGGRPVDQDNRPAERAARAADAPARYPRLPGKGPQTGGTRRRGLPDRVAVAVGCGAVQVVAGTLPVNHDIIEHLQDVFNLLPNLNAPALVSAFTVSANDQLMVLYLASVVRAILALHTLINNKVRPRVHLDRHGQTD